MPLSLISGPAPAERGGCLGLFTAGLRRPQPAGIDGTALDRELLLVKQKGIDCWCELPIGRVGGIQFKKDCEISSGFDLPDENDPNEAVNGAQFQPPQSQAAPVFVAEQEYRVLLKGDFIRDAENKRGIDADHLPPWLPKRLTGDGTEGGTFESWSVTAARGAPARVISVDPPDGAQFPSREGNFSPPPASIDIFFNKGLQQNMVKANTTVGNF